MIKRVKYYDSLKDRLNNSKDINNFFYISLIEFFKDKNFYALIVSIKYSFIGYKNIFLRKFRRK